MIYKIPPGIWDGGFLPLRPPPPSTLLANCRKHTEQCLQHSHCKNWKLFSAEKMSRIEKLPWRKKVFSRFPAHKDKSKIYLEKIKVEMLLLNWSLLNLIRWDPGWAKNRHTGHQMLFGGRRRYRQIGQCFHLRYRPVEQQSFHLSHHQLKLIPLPPLQSPSPSTHPKKLEYHHLVNFCVGSLQRLDLECRL